VILGVAGSAHLEIYTNGDSCKGGEETNVIGCVSSQANWSGLMKSFVKLEAGMKQQDSMISEEHGCETVGV